MNPRGGPPGPRRRTSALSALLLAALARLYGALLVLYPKAFRRRYGEEMRRDFCELSREGLEEGGAPELVRVWAQALTDLVLTALKERSTMPVARRYAYYLSMDPRIAARAAARAMVGVVVVVALGVTGASLLQEPIYEAEAEVWIDPGAEEIQTLPSYSEDLQQFIPSRPRAIDSRPVVDEVLRRLGSKMAPSEFLNNLTIVPLEGTNLIRLTYEDNSAAKAADIVNTTALVSSKRIPEAAVYVKARVPTTPTPVSPRPVRNGLLTLVTGLVLCGGLTLALPGVAARAAGKLGGQAVRQGVGQAGIPRRRHGGSSEANVLKEQELLEALDRRGKLTAVEAALETSLSVEEANRMLFELAARGHLEVTVEHGRLLYSFWEHGA